MLLNYLDHVSPQLLTVACPQHHRTQCLSLLRTQPTAVQWYTSVQSAMCMWEETTQRPALPRVSGKDHTWSVKVRSSDSFQTWIKTEALCKWYPGNACIWCLTPSSTSTKFPPDPSLESVYFYGHVILTKAWPHDTDIGCAYKPTASLETDLSLSWSRCYHSEKSINQCLAQPHSSRVFSQNKDFLKVALPHSMLIGGFFC